MKIDSSEQLLSSVYRFNNETTIKKDASSDTQSGAVTQGSDRVEWSQNKAKIEQLKTMMRGMPDSQQGNIARIREQLADGSYQVAAAETAGKMLEQWRDIHAN